MYFALSLSIISLVLLIGERTVESAEQGTTIYGKEIGPLSSLAHGLKGDVYVVDSKRIRVRHLYYDGTAPAAYFWTGLKGKQGNTVDDSGIAIPDESGRLIVLKKYEDGDVVLTLPGNITVDQLSFVAIWCRQFHVNFGDVIFPEPLADIPAPQNVGSFSMGPVQHGVGSNEVIVLDTETVLVRKFSYDGTGGKDVFFVAGNGSRPNPTPSNSLLLIKLARIDGGLTALPALNGVDVSLRIPPGPAHLTIFNFTLIAVYSNATAQVFGQIVLPETLIVPPFIESTEVPVSPN